MGTESGILRCIPLMCCNIHQFEVVVDHAHSHLLILNATETLISCEFKWLCEFCDNKV